MQTPEAAADSNRKWWIMAAVASGVFLSTIDGSIVNVALPTLGRELDAPFAAVQWVVLAYLLTLVTLMLVAGRLADIHGKKRLYAAGFVVFSIGSLLCGMAPSIGWLLAARVLQGSGASLLMALGAAIAAEAFPASERGKALGLIGAMVSIGLVSGPTLGGLILGAVSWQAIFYVNLPIGVLGTALVCRFVPSSPVSSRQPFDLGGAALLFTALLGFLLAITLGPRAAVGSAVLIGLMVLALVCGIAFVHLELSIPAPLFDFRLFRNSTLATNVITGAVVFVASAGLVFLLPFYLQSMQGRSARDAGLLLVVSPLMIGVVSPISGRLSDRVGFRPLTVLGLASLVIAYALLSTLELESSAAQFVARVVWLGLGMGMFQSPNNSAIMGSVPREHLGVASGLLSLTRTLGQTTGIALIGAAWAGIVHAADSPSALEATQAPVSAQLWAFHWVARGTAALLCVALAFAVASWRRKVVVGK